MSELAPEVEVTEEVTETPAATENTPAPKMVPADRFNGLQRKLQEVIAENAALKAAQQTPSTSATPETPAPTTQPEETGLEAFLADLMTERVEAWRDKAIELYPSVKPLREYLTANTRAETLALAKDLAEKLGGVTPSSEEATETVTATTPTPTTPSPSVTGGSPALPPAPSDDEELAELRQKAARTHSNADYSAFLRKKFAMAGEEYPG